MSSGADCSFTEVEPGSWTYDIQQYPYGAVEDYDHHGPFPSLVAAQAHLARFHGNPGGWTLYTHPTDHRHERHPVEPRCLACWEPLEAAE